MSNQYLAWRRCTSDSYLLYIPSAFKYVKYFSLSFQQMYLAFGGTAKGLSFKDLTCGLVLLTRGRQEEKMKCKLDCTNY